MLAEQRSAYYKELLRYKGFENAQMPPPGRDWDEAVKRRNDIQQNPVRPDARARLSLTQQHLLTYVAHNTW